MENTTNHPKEKKSKDFSILQSPDNAGKILQLTADTMFLLSKDGICLDIDLHTDRWFLQDKSAFIGKNIFEIIPSETAMAIQNNFNKVIATGITSTDNYETQLSGKTYFFKCIIYNYDENRVLCQYRDITQRVVLKKKLEIMNQKLQEIEKVAQIGQWVYFSASKDLYFSGYSGGLAVNGDTTCMNLKEYLEHLHPEDIAPFVSFLDKSLSAYSNDYLDYRFIHGDKMFFFRLKTINCTYENGNKQINGYVQNITDIMEKQHELAMVKLAVENSTDYIFAMKTDGQLVFGNKRFKEHNGWLSNEDITRINFFEGYKRGTDKTRWQDIINQLIVSNQTINFVLPKPVLDKPDILAFDCTSYLIQDAKSDDLIWTFGKDITERAQYEKQVKELNQIMSTILTNIPMSISVKDVNNNLKYIFSNQIGDDFHWGIKDGMIGKTDFELFPKEEAEKMRAEDLVTINNKHESRKFLENKDSSGEYQAIDQLRILVKDEIRPLLIAIERDITKDKQMERELIDAKEKAEESDKLKSAFIANISHEIRTPLNAIVGFSRIIAETQDMDERKSFYSIVESNNARLLGLINEILDISKIESGIMEFHNESIVLTSLCKDLVQTLKLRCNEGVQLLFEESDPDLIIKSDKNRLTQVFTNLIGNALKFTQHGNVTIGYNKKNDHIDFYVKDTGSGIPSDKINRVFERFVKADNFSQGTGLGLSICKSIIERMGGAISVQSTLDVGSCFTFTLPNRCIVDYIENSRSIESGQAEVTRKEAVILIAEDTDSNYALLEAMIGKSYTLKRANNGLEVVNMFEAIHPDLILMDIKMPDMSGFDAAKIIRTISQDVPIIAQSAFAFEEDRKKAIESGCNDFLAKPFKKKQVLELISRYLI